MVNSNITFIELKQPVIAGLNILKTQAYAQA